MKRGILPSQIKSRLGLFGGKRAICRGSGPDWRAGAGAQLCCSARNQEPFLPSKGKAKSSEANGGAWVDLENAGKLIPPRTCLGLSASAFISRHAHYPGASDGARSPRGGGNENTKLAGASLHDFGVTFVILGVASLPVKK